MAQAAKGTNSNVEISKITDMQVDSTCRHTVESAESAAAAAGVTGVLAIKTVAQQAACFCCSDMCYW
jgi:hypothetical protein